MDTEKCVALLMAVECGSMSTAAARLGYTPSGILRMIDSLEAELGMRLVERTTRGVSATTEGRQVIPLLQDVVRAADRARQRASEVEGLLSGEIDIASYSSVAATWLPPILKAFESEYPGVRVRTREAGNEQIVEWVERRAIDCAIFARRKFRGDWIDLRKDRLMVWLPADHPRAGDEAFPLAELEGAPFVETSPNQDTDIARLLATEHLVPDVRYTTTSSYTTYCMVEAGLGISVNNELMMPRWQGNVAILPLDPPRSISLGIAVPSLSSVSPATARFIECARRCVRSL